MTPTRLSRSRPREFYSIGEVCESLGIKPHVLRYWETQFDGLSPTKNRAGNRMYRLGELELIALIQRLLHEDRYTIEGARMKLSAIQRQGDADEESARALERAFIRSLRHELDSLEELLDPKST